MLNVDESDNEAGKKQTALNTFIFDASSVVGSFICSSLTKISMSNLVFSSSLLDFSSVKLLPWFRCKETVSNWCYQKWYVSQESTNFIYITFSFPEKHNAPHPARGSYSPCTELLPCSRGRLNASCRLLFLARFLWWDLNRDTKAIFFFFTEWISLNGRYEASLLFEKTFISRQYASLGNVFIFPIK